MLREFSLRVDGADPAAMIAVHSPYDASVVGSVPTVDSAGMERAISVAAGVFQDRASWLPAHRRADILRAVSQRLETEAEEMAHLASSEGGKPISDSLVEVRRASITLRLCAEEATRCHGEQIPMDGSGAGEGRIAFTLREPIGVVAAISAFNHPCNLIAHQAGTALAAGCPVLVKPDPRTPLSCFALLEMLYDAGLPAEWATAVPCETQVAQELATSDRIGFLSFIGSAKVGWLLRSKLAPGVRCALEHGGIAPAIVDETVDIAKVVPPLVKAGYTHAGQVCVSLQRVFVHNSVRERFSQAFVAAVQALRVGNPLAPETEVGPIIDKPALQRIDTAVREASAFIACGGHALDHNCYAPTVLLNPPADATAMREEVFGPVVCVCGYDRLEEAVARANDERWAFQSAIFTQDVSRALETCRLLDAATVMINDHPAFRVDWMPFGGRRHSGLGVGGVAPSVREQTQGKLIVMRR